MIPLAGPPLVLPFPSVPPALAQKRTRVRRKKANLRTSALSNCYFECTRAYARLHVERSLQKKMQRVIRSGAKKVGVHQQTLCTLCKCHTAGRAEQRWHDGVSVLANVILQRHLLRHNTLWLAFPSTFQSQSIVTKKAAADEVVPFRSVQNTVHNGSVQPGTLLMLQEACNFGNSSSVNRAIYLH